MKLWFPMKRFETERCVRVAAAVIKLWRKRIVFFQEKHFCKTPTRLSCAFRSKKFVHFNGNKILMERMAVLELWSCRTSDITGTQILSAFGWCVRYAIQVLRESLGIKTKITGSGCSRSIDCIQTKWHWRHWAKYEFFPIVRYSFDLILTKLYTEHTSRNA